MLRCVHSEEEERGEEEQRGEKEQHGEEEEEDELERVPRQTRRSHVVAPPIVPAWEGDRVLIKPLGDR
jgi:nitrate reductase cytochrome c-type subunit